MYVFVWSSWSLHLAVQQVSYLSFSLKSVSPFLPHPFPLACVFYCHGQDHEQSTRSKQHRGSGCADRTVCLEHRRSSRKEEEDPSLLTLSLSPSHIHSRPLPNLFSPVSISIYISLFAGKRSWDSRWPLPMPRAAASHTKTRASHRCAPSDRTVRTNGRDKQYAHHMYT